MNAKEALDKIRQLFAEEAGMNPEPPAPTEMEAKEYVLEDGTKLLISDLEVGGMVNVLDANGTPSPAPVGDHKLMDGTVITVAENGLISAVVMPAAPAAPTEDMSAKFAEVTAEHASIRAELSAQNAALRAELDAVNVKLKGLADVFSSLVNVPAAEPLEQPKNTFAAHGQSKAEKMERLRATIDALKAAKN